MRQIHGVNTDLPPPQVHLQLYGKLSFRLLSVMKYSKEKRIRCLCTTPERSYVEILDQVKLESTILVLPGSTL